MATKKLWCAAIKKSGINRSEIFVTSKLWVDHFTYEKAQQGIDESLTKLGLTILIYTCFTNLMVTQQVHGEL
jgi:diketogulonate reductase-like aldo/keto reductase